MKTKLITALRSAATALECGWFEYQWNKPESCNCGIIACALMHKSIDGMKDLIIPMRANSQNISWVGMMHYHCPITGIPENEVFRALFKAGMNHKDIGELEFLSNPKVLDRLEPLNLPAIAEHRSMDPTPESVKNRIDYRDKNNAIQYMRAWADLLEEEGRDDVVPQPSETKEEVPA